MKITDKHCEIRFNFFFAIPKKLLYEEKKIEIFTDRVWNVYI